MVQSILTAGDRGSGTFDESGAAAQLPNGAARAHLVRGALFLLRTRHLRSRAPHGQSVRPSVSQLDSQLGSQLGS